MRVSPDRFRAFAQNRPSARQPRRFFFALFPNAGRAGAFALAPWGAGLSRDRFFFLNAGSLPNPGPLSWRGWPCCFGPLSPRNLSFWRGPPSVSLPSRARARACNGFSEGACPGEAAASASMLLMHLMHLFTGGAWLPGSLSHVLNALQAVTVHWGAVCLAHL